MEVKIRKITLTILFQPPPPPSSNMIISAPCKLTGQLLGQPPEHFDRHVGDDDIADGSLELPICNCGHNSVAVRYHKRASWGIIFLYKLPIFFQRNP